MFNGFKIFSADSIVLSKLLSTRDLIFSSVLKRSSAGFNGPDEGPVDLLPLLSALGFPFFIIFLTPRTFSLASSSAFLACSEVKSASELARDKFNSENFSIQLCSRGKSAFPGNFSIISLKSFNSSGKFSPLNASASWLFKNIIFHKTSKVSIGIAINFPKNSV